jgi:hypothetical protein
MIQLERWEPTKDDSRKMEYAGQRTAQEVYQELKYRLKNNGLLPDEYFLMDSDWNNGREIPKGADIFCATDYGGCEGIYLDVYLKWHENNKPIIKSFITGKTLGESGSDLDRMFLISSAITKAFHGEKLKSDSMILHLNPSEQQLFINALVEQRERLVEQTDGVEQLLRRMTGSITAYMDTVGQRPLHISDYDKTILAIRDGELETFQALLPKVMDRDDELMVKWQVDLVLSAAG